MAGKSAVVVGATGNLGPTWCTTLYEHGADLTLVIKSKREDSRSLSRLPEALVSEALVADIREPTEVDRIARAYLEKAGRPADILVCNSGVDDPPESGRAKPALTEPREQPARNMFDVNVLGTLYCIQSFGQPMVEAGSGSIVLVGSLYATSTPDNRLYVEAGLPGFYKHPAYPASKAAVLSLARYFAAEWGKAGVRVNVLSPGGVDCGQGERFQTAFSARTPAQRLAAKEDLRGPLMFLVSDMSRYVNGIDLRVDGGYGVW